MLGVLVELNGLIQLSKLKQSSIENEQRELLSYLNLNKENFLRGGNCFYFHFPYRKEEVALIWGSIQRLFRYLLSRRDEYQGFLIVIDKVPKLPLAEGFQRMRKISLPLRNLDTLHLTIRAAETFPRLNELTRKGNFMLLRDVERSQITANLLGNNFFRRDELLDKIRQSLIPQFGEESYRRLYHFHGPRGVGKLWNLREALKSIRVEDFSPPVPLFIGETRETIPEEGLLRTIPPGSLEELGRHFTPLEASAWKDRRFLFHSSLHDDGGPDCLISLRLYLTAYRRACEEALIPPFIIIRNPGEFGEAATQILTSLLKEKQKPRLVPLIITEESELPPPWNRLKCQKMRINPLSLKEIEDRLEEAFLKNLSPEKILKKSDEKMDILAHYILLQKSGSVNLQGLRGKELSQALVGCLGLLHQKIIYILSLYPGVMDQLRWAEGLDRAGIPLADDPQKVLEELFAMGLVKDPQAVRLGREGLEKGCDLSEKEKNGIRRTLMELWVSFPREEDSRVVNRLLFAFRYDPPSRNLIQLFFEEIFRSLEAGRSKAVEGFLERFEYFCGGGDPSPSQAVLKTLWLRSTLMEGNREMARVRFLAFKEIPENPLTLPEALYNLEAGRYYHACGEYQKALNDAKSALLYFQRYADSPLIEADANCQIGLGMAGMRRFEEGIVYFEIAQEILRADSNPHKIIKIIAYEGLCYFLLGNYAKAQRLARKAQEKASASGRREWELFTVLLQGRISFELGDYKKAEYFFAQGLNYCEIYFETERKQVFYAWMIRCQIYQNKTAQALTLLKTLRPTCEVLYFAAEALFFMGQQHRALNALNLALKNREGRIDEFAPGEHLSWKTGFASLEDRAIRGSDGNGVLVHCVRAFQGYLLGMGEGKKEEGYRELSRIIRDEKICDEDPYTHFYYYLYNQIVPMHGNTETVDRLTLLSRGLKYLQLRGGRIDETKVKQAYLNNNYWNGKLMMEGRTQRIL